MRTLKKQLLHTYFVMYDYAIAEIVRTKATLPKIEDAIRMLWDVIFHGDDSPIHTAGENLC